MRRTRKCSRDSSQDSPVTDNERDIIWGDSPPPRRICLSTTPGRRVTRATAAEQDLTDLIECMHPKQENKESSTPPLLGLWMRNRQEPDSGQKRRRPARLARRTTGRKLSRIGLDKTVLDDLRILTEWTDNLAATVEEPSGHPQKDDADAETEGTIELEGGEAMDCDNLEDLFDDDDDDDVAINVDCNKMETRQVMREKRKSSNFSFSDDLWDSDDWCDDDSIIRIATQVENEALTRQMQQEKGRIESLNSNADTISPTQNEHVNAKSKMCLSYNQSKTIVCNGVNLQSKNSGLSVQTTYSGRMDSGSSMTRGAKAVSRPTWTIQSTAQVPVSRNTCRGSQMPSQKPATMSYRKGPVHTSRSHAPSLNSKAVSTAPIPSTSTHQSAKSVSNANPLCAKNNVYTNANMNVSRRTVHKGPVKASCAPTKCMPPVKQSLPVNAALQAGNGQTTCTRLSEKTARVPPMTDAINAASVKGQGFNDSLDDLFAGDNSLPDDMLLALLDNDSDFEEITKEAPSTVPVGSNSSTQKQLSGDFTGNVVGNSCKPTVTKTPTHSMSTRAQYSSEGTSKSKGSDSCTTSKYSSRSSTPKNPNQSSVVATHSRFTRSTAQSPVTKQSINHQAVPLDRKNVGVESGQGRRSLSQPVPPAVKEGGVPVQRGCSQQEIEQKRQAALAKRKKSKLRVSPIA